ncbi:Glycosyl transferase family 2 [Pedobacter westerhofensis]|uniref:Glycosyl transferase family 2 n=1 Tax=Pedobacter westerhofensis TaxID=425512 RepID=A0A521C5W1_9SPHI|nr:glycosyltransferase [Pedobacter westerhofensis]SMO54784.1 Glycosyl transferase family 2 [Pedobacter westerhofensis]
MLVSICIPTYSRLDYLKEAVHSVFAQTFRDFEICVSLDPKPSGPDQEIESWCRKTAQENLSFRYLVNEKNVGLSGNWNVLANMAKGDYVIIIGDDDSLEPQYLENVTKNIGRYHPDVVFTDQNFIDSDAKILDELTEEMSAVYFRKGLQSGLLSDPVETVLRNTVPMSSSIIRRELILKYPYDPSLNTPELEVFLKIAASGGVFEYVARRVANYRVHPGSATSGGLKLHYMLRNIIPVEVHEKYENLKYELISSKMIPAVNICIREGNISLGKTLLGSKYYPSDKNHLKMIQKLLFYCPTFIAKKII